MYEIRTLKTHRTYRKGDFSCCGMVTLLAYLEYFGTDYEVLEDGEVIFQKKGRTQTFFIEGMDEDPGELPSMLVKARKMIHNEQTGIY